MTQIKDLSKNDLLALRQQIVLSSLFTNDFDNSMGIDPYECQAFFEGYVENLFDISYNDHNKDLDIFDIFDEYDNVNNLYDYWCDYVASLEDNTNA